jgi:hypothetical protein
MILTNDCYILNEVNWFKHRTAAGPPQTQKLSVLMEGDRTKFLSTVAGSIAVGRLSVL